MALERPSSNDRIKAALWFADHGFKVFPVWSASDEGVCRCPKGKDCDQPGKHPIGAHGFKEATDNGDRIKTFLSAGSEPNYGLLCPEGVFALDVDGDGVALLAKLEARYGSLPATLRTVTAHGEHVFLRWPAELPRPIGQLFGYVTRWGTGRDQGYVIGPRSVHASGKAYAPGATFEIATLPDAWAQSAVRPASPTSITITGSYQVAGTIPASKSRYEEIRSYTAHLYNKRLSVDEMWPLVRDYLAPRFEDKLTETELRSRFERVTAHMAERLGAPAFDDKPAIPADLSGELFVNVLEYCANIPDEVPWAAYPIAYFGGVTLLAGIWKGGKSTLMSQFQRCRETGESFLGSPVPAGPTILVTEEGGIPVKRKVAGLAELLILDRQSAVLRHLSFDALLLALETFCNEHSDEARPLIFLDTFAVWGDIEDENDAAEITLAISKLTVFAQRTGAAVVLVHHVRKDGGAHGKGIRGSGAMAATVDIFAVLDYVDGGKETDRSLKIEGRVLDALGLKLGFDPIARRYDLLDSGEEELMAIERLLKDIPADGAGFSRSELQMVWNGTRGKVETDALWLESKGRMRKSWGKVGNANGWRYWSIPAAWEAPE